MATFKCKMCGGSLEITEGKTVCTCEYCGTEQTLPRLDSDKKANLYDRANHFRRNNDYDKAMSIYEQILNEDGTDAEAYWSLVLCKYGIEYVEDPATHKRIPTVNRAQFTSIFDDENYKEALANADTLQKAIYEEEAKTINDIQKGILAISSKEEPFDVFICYKETDENGRRTPDSVLANDLYHQLTQEGFKVFFARITLEDKLGQEYEPYIFAALNSSKAMVVLGTKPEYFNAVWVKNEWSRYLALIKNGEKKILIPAYKDMDPYDLPEEFSHLQAQDMGKLGFMQDLIRGIRKIIGGDRNISLDNIIKQQTSNNNVSALLKRGYMALEDSEWDKADVFFEDVLNQDAENGDAYFGKLLCNNHCSDAEALKNKYISKYETASTEQLVACDENIEHIKNQAYTYTVPNFVCEEDIYEAYEYDRSYKSSLSSRKKQKENQLNEIYEDKLLNKCKKFTRGNTNAELNDVLDELSRVLDNRIQEAMINDERAIAQVKKDYNAFVIITDEKIQLQYQNNMSQIEEEYEKIINDYKECKDYSDYQNLLERCADIDFYKNTSVIISECKQKIVDFNYKSAEAMISQIQNEKKLEDVLGEFEKIKEYKKSRDYIEKLNRVREGWKIKNDLINDRKKEIEKTKQEIDELHNQEKDSSNNQLWGIIWIFGAVLLFIIFSMLDNISLAYFGLICGLLFSIINFWGVYKKEKLNKSLKREISLKEKNIMDVKEMLHGVDEMSGIMMGIQEQFSDVKFDEHINNMIVNAKIKIGKLQEIQNK